MGEIINLNIGKAGVRIGQKFLDKIAKQHFEGSQQNKGKSNIFFNEKQDGFQSRSFFLDIDPRPIQRLNLIKSKYSINSQNLFPGTGLSADLFSTGNYLQGTQIALQAMNIIRKSVQNCDNLSGFLINHSLGGGTGSGLTSNIIGRLRQSYCTNIVEVHPVLPQTQTFYSPLQIYNSVFGLNSLIQNTDLVMMTQNQAFGKRLFYQGNISPSLQDVNDLHAQCLCQTTAPYRYGGNLNSNPRKSAMNLVMFPRMKFLAKSFSFNQLNKQHLQSTFDQKNFSLTNFFRQETSRDSIYTMQFNSRDNFVFQNQINEKVNNWLSNRNLQMCQWIPHNIHISITQPSSSNSSSMIINSRNVVKLFQRWSQLFTTSFRKEAFIHHYLEAGMDKMEFTQAQSNLNDLVSEYTPCYFYGCYDEDICDDENGEQIGIEQ